MAQWPDSLPDLAEVRQLVNVAAACLKSSGQEVARLKNDIAKMEKAAKERSVEVFEREIRTLDGAVKKLKETIKCACDRMQRPVEQVMGAPAMKKWVRQFDAPLVKEESIAKQMELMWKLRAIADEHAISDLCLQKIFGAVRVCC